MMIKKVIFITLGLIINISFGQLSFDRSRVILREGAGSQSLTVKNDGTQAHLAQAWIENTQGEKVLMPIAAVPLLQRVNPKQEKQIRINLVGVDALLPTDRETLFYLNVLGVPPKTAAGDSEVSIVVRSNMKLFYRPKALPNYKANEWLDKITIQRTGNTITFENPTPFYGVIFAVVDSHNKGIQYNLDLKPFGAEEARINVGGGDFKVLFIDDYGATTQLNYSCSNNSCTGVFDNKQGRR